ncbi:MAG TPA: serine dehydratase subunit alpha family protein [Tissierellia bacterium]|jgi:L-cysteine desulfidase|nr:serine dehydratase subunit alpha family protein [Tissierellia bacterium]
MKKEEISAILLEELKLAMGCTEPAALALAAARAAGVLDDDVIKIHAKLSANIIKNAKAVTIPNSDGMKGIKAALVLGALEGDASHGLAVFSHLSPDASKRAREWLETYPVELEVLPGEENLKIDLTLSGKDHTARVILERDHDHFSEVWRDHVCLESHPLEKDADRNPRKQLTLENIFDYVEGDIPEEVIRILKDQIHYNTAISQEGFKGGYGLDAGLTRRALDTGVRGRAVSAAAAGSDARMGGSALPVVINFGSGNQGITLSVPILEYAKENNVEEEKVLRSLCLSNLLSLRVKSGMGKLSAFCGAVSAATAAVASISYMLGGTREEVYHTMINTLGNTGGIVCDGAKGSCAIKIVSALDSAFLAYELAQKGKHLTPGEGIIREDWEKTLDHYARLGMEGMHETDAVILQMMLDEE